MSSVDSESSDLLSSSDTTSLQGTPEQDYRRDQTPLDSFVRQTLGREPYMSFPSRPNRPLPRLYRPGVPTSSNITDLDEELGVVHNVLPPARVQLQECQTCSEVFCSEINYRRHNRTHKRIFVADKEDWTTARTEIGAYWDRLSPADGHALVKSLTSVDSEDNSGAKAVKALSKLVSQQASIIQSLPAAYLKAGVRLLDIVHNSNSENFNVSAETLFRIFDCASEGTFLIGNTGPKDQKVFCGDEHIGLDYKNLVSYLGFLLEHKLIKSWMKDKDEQALLCQRLLIAEEEVRREKLAQTAEKKKQKSEEKK